MAKKTTRKKETVWWYVYRGINRTKKEIYFGVSKDPPARKDGSHCVGGTKALAHWDCDNDDIRWRKISKHLTQKRASTVAHYLERNTKPPKGDTVIQTAGI